MYKKTVKLRLVGIMALDHINTEGEIPFLISIDFEDKIQMNAHMHIYIHRAYIYRSDYEPLNLMGEIGEII